MGEASWAPGTFCHHGALPCWRYAAHFSLCLPTASQFPSQLPIRAGPPRAGAGHCPHRSFSFELWGRPHAAVTSARPASSPSVAFTVEFRFSLGSSGGSTSGSARSLIPHKGFCPLAWDRLPAGGWLDLCPFASLWAESSSCSGDDFLEAHSFIHVGDTCWGSDPRGLLVFYGELGAGFLILVVESEINT